MNSLPILLSWSSGKDSAWALHKLRRDARYDVRGLITTVNAQHERVAMHAVRRVLLESQARAVGLPLHVVEIPSPCTDAMYREAFLEALREMQREGIQDVAFGDLFLQDVRDYREKLLAEVGMSGVFPLWGRSTRDLASRMVDHGLRARLTCVDPRNCPREFAGSEFDAELLRDLPEEVDRCGENGEFHTFVYDGPMFERPIAIRRGETLERDGFVFHDLHPDGGVRCED